MQQEVLNIVVETWLNGTMESRRVVDHNSGDDRRWMGKHCFWAFRTGREVRTYPVQERYS